MKASNLRSGTYFAKIMEIKDGDVSGTITDCIFHKTGNHVQYFGTEYFDDAKNITGIFYRLTPEKIKNKLNKVDK